MTAHIRPKERKGTKKAARQKVCGAYKLAKSGKLNGLVEMGKRFVQDMNYVELDNSDRTANRKRMADYDRWAKVNDARIRNHGRL